MKPRISYGNRSADSILHSLTVSNKSDREIDVYEVGLASFDAFNELLTRSGGWATTRIAVGAQHKGDWEQKPSGAFRFNKFGTAVAYVNAVRFTDGTIWRADPGAVLVELQKFAKDLKPEDLKEQRVR